MTQNGCMYQLLPIKYKLKLPSEGMPGLWAFRSRSKQCAVVASKLQFCILCRAPPSDPACRTSNSFHAHCSSFCDFSHSWAHYFSWGNFCRENEEFSCSIEPKNTHTSSVFLLPFLHSKLQKKSSVQWRLKCFCTICSRNLKCYPIHIFYVHT